MKALFATLLALSPLSPAIASSPEVYRYTERCWVYERPTTCVVVDTRTHDGFLDTRGIYNDQYGYTMKQRFVGAHGFLTWDSVTKQTYKYPYEAVRDYTSRVTPHLVIMNVSWD
jgi:hypothetical protein